MTEEQEYQLCDILHDIRFDAISGDGDAHKEVQKIKDVFKPRLIPGVPTKPGWYWLKHIKFNYVGGSNPKPFIAHVGAIEEKQIFTGCSGWMLNAIIASHCPVEEPS